MEQAPLALSHLFKTCSLMAPEAYCQHPYCGTCSFCVSESFDPEAELLDYQCMCLKCAKVMNRR